MASLFLVFLKFAKLLTDFGAGESAASSGSRSPVAVPLWRVLVYFSLLGARYILNRDADEADHVPAPGAGFSQRNALSAPVTWAATFLIFFRHLRLFHSLSFSQCSRFFFLPFLRSDGRFNIYQTRLADSAGSGGTSLKKTVLL